MWVVHGNCVPSCERGEQEVVGRVGEVAEGALDVSLEAGCLQELLRGLDALNHSVNIENVRQNSWVDQGVVKGVG